MPVQLKTYYDWLLKGGIYSILIGIVATVLLAIFAPDWVTVLAPLVKIGGFLTAWHLFDKYGLKDYDTLEEIFVKKNMPFAIVFSAVILSFALIIV